MNSSEFNDTSVTDEFDSITDSQDESSPLSDTQEIILYLLNTFAAILSIIGSLLILLIVRNSKRKKRSLSVYDRLLVGLSVADFVCSCNFMFGAFLVPKGDRVWAFGNDATCTVTGFLGSTVPTSLLYSAMISLYYALLVRYGFQDEQLSGCMEFFMHFVCIILPVIGHVILLLMDAYGPKNIGLSCYTSDYPKGCVQIPKDEELPPGEVRCEDTTAATITSGISSMIAGFTIMTCNLIIYCHVRSSLRQYRKKAFARWENATGFFEATTEAPSSQAARVKEESSKMSKNRLGFGGSGDGGGGGRKKTKRKSFLRLKREISNRDNQMHQVRAVLNQSLFYVGSMALVNIPMSAQFMVGSSHTVNRSNESDLFLFLCFTTFMAPLQGIFNLMIFCRPTYLRVRRSFPNETRINCFLRALEAGTSDNRDGRRRRHGGKLRRHPTPKRSVSWRNWFWVTKWSNSESSDNSRIISSKSAASKSEEAKIENVSSGNNDSDKKSHNEDDGKSSDNDAAIQLVMEETSSSSKTPTGNDNSENATNAPIAPDVEDSVGPCENGDDGPLLDWRNIEFDSSCIGIFSSTTSTVEA